MSQQNQLSLEEQIQEAVNTVKDMFGGYEPEFVSEPPPGATVYDLWEEILKLRKEVHAYKKLRRGVKPKVETAVKLLLCDPRLSQIPIPMIAEIIREVFKSFGLDSKCSEASVRWYQSQNSLDWSIVRRTLPPVKLSDVNSST